MRTCAALAVGLLLVTAGAAMAAPIVGSVTGTAVAGGTLVITGSGFGAKATPGPVLYDTGNNIPAYTARGLVNGDQVPVVADGDCPTCPWGSRIPASWGNAPRWYTVADSVRVPGRPLYKVSRKGYFRGPNPLASLSENGEVYLSWWYRANHRLYSTTGGAAFNKLIRFTAGNTSTDWEEQIEIEAQNSYGNSLGCSSTGWAWLGGYTEPAANTWNHVELYIKGGGNLAQGSGTADIYFNGQRVSGTNSLYSCQGMLDHVYVWGTDPNVPTLYPTDSKILFGEFYLDTTRARVVASTSSSYTPGNSAPTVWEIQPAQSWQDGEVRVAFNAGTFAPGSTVYLYVVDALGGVSNPGSVVMGGSVDPGPPGMPGQPQH